MEAELSAAHPAAGNTSPTTDHISSIVVPVSEKNLSLPNIREVGQISVQNLHEVGVCPKTARKLMTGII